MSDFTPGPWEAWLPGRKFVGPTRNFRSVCELTVHDGNEVAADANANRIVACVNYCAGYDNDALLAGPPLQELIDGWSESHKHGAHQCAGEPVAIEELDAALQGTDSTVSASGGILWVDTSFKIRTRGQLRDLCRLLDIPLPN